MESKDAGFYPRMGFSSAFLVAMIISTLRYDGKLTSVVSAEECISDFTFDLTDGLNSFTRQNLWFRDLMIIFNSFCVDVTLISLLYLWSKGAVNSTSWLLALMVSVTSKTMIQSLFMAMLQPLGFNWYFPGVYAFIVTFYDINDFYYSGHLVNASIFCYTLFGL